MGKEQGIHSTDLDILSSVCSKAERLLCSSTQNVVAQQEEASINNTHITPHFLSFSNKTETESHYSYVNKETQAILETSFSMQVLHDNRKVRYFNGVIDREMFVVCFNFICHDQLHENSESRLALQEQILLVLVKLLQELQHC